MAFAKQQHTIFVGTITRIKKALKELDMKHSELLFLVIALLHSPHERNCVKIILDGFEPKTPKSRNCKSDVYTTGRIVLDEGETLENLPQSIIIQFKCPYFTHRYYAHELGREDGGWDWLWTAPFNSCAPPETPYPHWNCTHSEGRSYRITTMQTPYYAMKYCRMRLFFVNLLTDDKGRFIPKDHGWIGLSREVVFKEFIGKHNDIS